MIINAQETQTHAKTHQGTVDEYAELLKSRRYPFPPLVLYREKDSVYLLSDGIDRFLAAQKRLTR